MTQFYISRFYKPGSTSKVVDLYHIYSDADVQKLIKQQSSKTGQPHFWSAGSFVESPTKASHVSSSALVLEYSKTADHKGICLRIGQLDYAVTIVETARGKAYLFPLEVEVEAGRYTRLVAALAEQIGHYGLVDGVASCAHLFRVEDNSQVISNDGQPIPPNYNFITTDLKEPIQTWMAEPTKTIRVNVDATQARAAVKSAAKSTFDELFEPLAHATDELIATSLKVREQLAQLRTQMEGQR